MVDCPKTSRLQRAYKYSDKLPRRNVKKSSKFKKDLSEDSDTDFDRESEENEGIEKISNRNSLCYSLEESKSSSIKYLDFSSLSSKTLKKLRIHFSLSSSKKTQLIESLNHIVQQKPKNDKQIIKDFLMKIS